MDIMANVSFPRKEIEKHIKLNDETIEKMLMMGIPAELSEEFLNIEVLVSRPDLISMQGFLRAYKAYYGKEPGLKKYKVQPSGYKLIVEKSLPKEWPYATACIVKGLEFNDANIKDIFIESTGPDLKTSKKIMNIIVSALADMGGKIYSIECIQQDGKKENIPDFTPESMKISLNNVNKLIGLDLKEKDLEKLLPKMGYDYKSGKVFIPAYRTDILHEVDIIEDIAIAYGYDNLTPEIPTVSTIGEESHESKMQTKIGNILSGLNILEISSYHLIKNEEADLFSLQDRIETENAKTDYKLLRLNLIIPALRILAENKDNEYPQKIFELGVVFKKSAKSESGIAEQSRLLIASTPGKFTELKQILDYLFKMLNLQYAIKESYNSHLIDGRTGEILLDGKSIGFIGEVHPQTLRNFNIKLPVS